MNLLSMSEFQKKNVSMEKWYFKELFKVQIFELKLLHKFSKKKTIV